MDLMPAVQRIQFITLSQKNRDLSAIAENFKELTDALNNRDEEKGVKTIRKYIINELEYALESIKC
jgi:DNA-binding FadR family transcriptional regulator